MRDDEAAAAAMQQIPKSSKTKLYETLGVKKGATAVDLKKAYRKEALRKHPDKGGDHDEFQQLKHAYDALADSHKRRVNDWFGDVGVQVFESGSMSMPQFMSIFIGLDVWDRCLILLALIICLGYLLLFPILLSIRWDYPHSMRFVHVFIPVWLGLSAILICCLYTLIAPSPQEDESTEEKEMMEHQRRMCGLASSVFILSLLTLLILLVLRLDGHTDWSYFWVIWPWILVEMFVLVVATTVIITRGKEPPLERTLMVASSAGPNVLHILFVCNIAYKMDGVPMTWWHVFWPIWASIALQLVVNTCRLRLFVKHDADLSSEEDKEDNMKKKASIHGSIVYSVICLIFTLLLCYKLTHPKAFPAFVMFLPLFVIVGCACCLLTCFICAPVMMPMPEEMKEVPPRATTYNTV